MKALVVYYSRGGTTRKMGEIIAEQITASGIETKCCAVDEISPKELLDYDGIIVGSPTYYGTMAAEIKKMLDESVSFHSKLDGKVGAAFSSSANIAGGNETTIMSLLQAMLIHGMIVQGDAQGDHYGPVAINKVDDKCREKCLRFASRFADLLKKVQA